MGLSLENTLSKKFFNIEEVDISKSESILANELQLAYEAYKRALLKYTMSSNNIYPCFTRQQIDAMLTMYPFVDTAQSSHLSSELGELCIAVNNMPIIINRAHNLLSGVNISNSTYASEIRDILKRFPSMEIQQNVLVTPSMYDSHTVFKGDSYINISEDTFKTFYSYKSIQIQRYLRLEHTTLTAFNKLIREDLKPIFLFDENNPGGHPHVSNSGLRESRIGENMQGYICFGSHRYMRNYQDYLNSSTPITSDQVMVGVFYNFLDWLQTVTIDDNYGNSFLLLKAHTAEDKQAAESLMDQYADPDKLDILFNILKQVNEYLNSNLIHKNDYIQSTCNYILVNLQKLDLVDKDNRVANTHILSIIVSLSYIMNYYGGSYLSDLLKEIYAKLLLIVYNYYSMYIPSMGIGVSGIIREGLEYFPVNFSQIEYINNMSEKAENMLLRSPQDILLAMLVQEKNFSNMAKFEEFAGFLRQLKVPNNIK